MATQSLDEETTKKVIRQVRVVLILALYFNIHFSTIIVHSIFGYLFFFFSVFLFFYQVEFYFSDSNLLTDGFMRKNITESEDGCILFRHFRISHFCFLFLCVAVLINSLDCDRTVISLALICSFNRMRTHLSLGDVKLEEVPEDIVNAVAQTLRNSASLKVSEDG